MAFPKEYLDLVLVSGGLLIMFAYNLFHLYKYHKHPKTTELGFENEKKKKMGWKHYGGQYSVSLSSSIFLCQTLHLAKAYLLLGYVNIVTHHLGVDINVYKL